MEDYQKQGTDFLTKHGLEFRAVLVGDDCPTFCPDAIEDRDMGKVNTYPRNTHIHGKHYRCTISAKDRGHLSIDFWNSYSDEEFNYYWWGDFSGIGWGFGRDNVYWDKHRKGKPYPDALKSPHFKKVPTAYDVLACITKDDVGTFSDFCSDFGYDEDSRRAEETYHAVCREYQKTRKFFTDAELEELCEIS